MTKKQIREGIGLTALNIFFIVLCFVTLIPILYALTVSLSGQNSLLSSDFSFIPKDFTLDNYKEPAPQDKCADFLFFYPQFETFADEKRCCLL